MAKTAKKLSKVPWSQGPITIIDYSRPIAATEETIDAISQKTVFVEAEMRATLRRSRLRKKRNQRKDE